MIISTVEIVLSLLFRFLEYAILLEVILSWVMPRSNNDFVNLLHAFTEPFMRPAKRLQEKIAPGFMIDFSPMIALFIIYLIRRIVFSIL